MKRHTRNIILGLMLACLLVASACGVGSETQQGVNAPAESTSRMTALPSVDDGVTSEQPAGLASPSRTQEGSSVAAAPQAGGMLQVGEGSPLYAEWSELEAPAMLPAGRDHISDYANLTESPPVAAMSNGLILWRANSIADGMPGHILASDSAGNVIWGYAPTFRSERFEVGYSRSLDVVFVHWPVSGAPGSEFPTEINAETRQDANVEFVLYAVAPSGEVLTGGLGQDSQYFMPDFRVWDDTGLVSLFDPDPGDGFDPIVVNEDLQSVDVGTAVSYQTHNTSYSVEQYRATAGETTTTAIPTWEDVGSAGPVNVTLVTRGIYDDADDPLFKATCAGEIPPEGAEYRSLSTFTVVSPSGNWVAHPYMIFSPVTGEYRCAKDGGDVTAYWDARAVDNSGWVLDARSEQYINVHGDTMPIEGKARAHLTDGSYSLTVMTEDVIYFSEEEGFYIDSGWDGLHPR